MSNKKVMDELRNRYLNFICAALDTNEDEHLRVGSNEIAIPCLDSEGMEQWVVVTVKVPTGSRDGEPYDGYGAAEDYKLKQEEKAIKAEAAAKHKAEKIARDQKAREDRARIRAEHKNTPKV